MNFWERVVARLEGFRVTVHRFEVRSSVTNKRELTEAEHKAITAAFAKFDEGFAELDKVIRNVLR